MLRQIFKMVRNLCYTGLKYPGVHRGIDRRDAGMVAPPSSVNKLGELVSFETLEEFEMIVLAQIELELLSDSVVSGTGKDSNLTVNIPIQVWNRVFKTTQLKIR